MVSEQPFSNESIPPISPMSSSPEQPQIHLNIHPISSTETTLVALNITAQINEKLTPSTFPQWRAQFEALLIGYDLLDYVTGISQCPLRVISLFLPYTKLIGFGKTNLYSVPFLLPLPLPSPHSLQQQKCPMRLGKNEHPLC
ncbi:hypothetical protein CK203_114672 [Vitis vinifera]|uniref:Retrovirus-related Pol polyprotein from transposon RE1 n=1 Tax=Vitis vinifera TaxID=29760 RepID=A0A438FEZ4_VITVI|nr:hypothetical protein CK203_114672 [Vitis vinifera]